MRKRVFGLAVAAIVGVALVSSSGAATTQAQKVTKIDVSTRAAVVHYLRSIHVNAKHAVIQRGGRNYAGARCPGTHWTCAGTRHTVVQIAKRGGQNRFMCRSSHCVVVQFSGTAHGVYLAGRRQAASAPTKPSNNTAFCVKTGSGATTGMGQSCTISQSGSGPNLAGVYENTQKVSGLTQTAQYTASITQQSSGSVGNRACVTQNINLDGSTSNMNGKPTTVNLQAYQSVTINQDAAAGANSAQYAADSTGACTSATLTQSQTLTSTVTAKGSITQNENQPAPPKGANVNIDIEQNQSLGFKCTTPSTCPSPATNTANFQQTMNQQAVANTPNGPVVQTQSSPDVLPNFSGLVGSVNQDSSTKSTAITTQNETQCEDAATGGLTTCHTAPGDADFNGTYPLTQTQHGPEGVFKAPASGGHSPVHYNHKGYGQAIQTGGTGDTFTINQFSQQDADLFDNQHNTQEADCITPGICTVNQTVIIDGNTTSNGDTGSDLSGVGINCEPGETGTDCTQSPPPPSGPVCNAASSTDANAAYNDIPKDVVDCGPPSEAFQANSTREFGDVVGLSNTAGSHTVSMTVDFQSFACESGSWNNNDCSTTPGSGFHVPASGTDPAGIRAKLYEVGPPDSNGNPTLGNLIATANADPAIPYRPSKDDTHCQNPGIDSNGGNDAGKWYDAPANTCRNSVSTLVPFNDFTFSNPNYTFTANQQVIWTVAFNTQSYGSTPIGSDGPWNSLNVGTMTYYPGNTPFAGTEVDPASAFVNAANSLFYCHNDTPINVLRIDTVSGTAGQCTSPQYTGASPSQLNAWTGLKPLGKIVLGQILVLRRSIS